MSFPAGLAGLASHRSHSQSLGSTAKSVTGVPSVIFVRFEICSSRRPVSSHSEASAVLFKVKEIHRQEHDKGSKATSARHIRCRETIRSDLSRTSRNQDGIGSINSMLWKYAVYCPSHRCLAVLHLSYCRCEMLFSIRTLLRLALRNCPYHQASVIRLCSSVF